MTSRSPSVPSTQVAPAVPEAPAAPAVQVASAVPVAPASQMASPSPVAQATPAARRARALDVAVPVATVIALLAAWQAVSSAGVFNSYVLPSPAQVAEAFWSMLESGKFARDAGISLLRVLKGFGIACGLALVLGSLRSLVPGSSRFFEHFVQFLRNVPPLSLTPLLILWCGIGETTKTVIIVLASFFPIYLNVVKGLTGCDPKLLEVGRMFGYSRMRRFVRIVVPSAVGDILVGMRTGLGYSWRAIIAAEMIAAATGLGHMILFAQQMSRTDEVIVGIFVIGLIGYVTDRLFGLLISKWLGDAYDTNGWE